MCAAVLTEEMIVRLTRERDEALQRAEKAELELAQNRTAFELLNRELDEVSIAEVALDVDYEALRGRCAAWQARAEAAEKRVAELEAHHGGRWIDTITRKCKSLLRKV